MDNYQALRALLTLGAITGAERPIRAAAESIFNSKLVLTIGPEEMQNPTRRAGQAKQNKDPSPEQEAHTERMFKSTFKDVLDKSVEPAMFNANTIDFHYSFGEFLNRYTTPLFYYRCEIRARNLNPKTWLLKMKRNDGKDLTNPDLRFAHATSHVQIGSNAFSTYQAEEEVIEKREQIRETLMTADMTNADYRAGGRDCLGCLCGGGSHGDPNYNFSQTYNFTSGGRLVLKTRGSGEQTCTIPEQGGKVIFEAQGNTGTITLETERITRETKIKKGETIIQEIDQEKLENEVETEELETLEQENEEEMNKELNSGGDREREQEPEKEPEKEQEIEKEDEQEHKPYFLNLSL
ncbi:21578_t:CDS:2, partial [Racocetra persica]